MLHDDELTIQFHLENLKASFFSNDPVFDSITGDEVLQPAIVLCPSDILTAFYALYPRLRMENQIHSLPAPSARLARKSSEESPKRSSGEYIRPILKKSHMFDLNESSESSQSETESDGSPIPDTEEIDIYGLSVKAAIDEMRRRLGPERCLGEKHPCDETWAAIYVSENGLSLSCIADFEDSESDGSQSDTDVILSKEEDSIIEAALLKLAESSNTGKPVKRPSVVIEPTPASTTKSRYRDDLISLTSPLVLPSRLPALASTPSQSSVLSAISEASLRSYSRGDYIEAQSFQHAYDLLKSIPTGPLTRNDFALVIGTIARKIQNKGNRHLVLVRTREVWFSYLLADRAASEAVLLRLYTVLAQMRCKMWYANHVRESKVWQRAKDVCDALYQMKSSKSGTTSSSAPVPGLKRNSSGLSLHRSNSMTRNQGSRFVPSRQSFDGFGFTSRPASLYNVSLGLASDDWFDILAASAEQGGPHKLSDYQVEITQRWLEEHASENFCRGEEIIHRFIAEVDDVMRRLVPETADEMTVVASAFWESDEFLEDAKEFGLLEYDRRFSRKDEGFTHAGRRSDEIPRSSSGVDLLGLLNRSRGKTIAHDMSDTRSIRSNHSRTASLTVNTRPLPDVFVRPSSSQSNSFPPPSPALSFFSRAPNTSPMLRSASHIDEKAATDFLEITRQRVLSLLLSDLGSEMWAGGSETDEWFSDGLADSCLERQRMKRKTDASRVLQKGKKVPNIPGKGRRPSLREFSFGDDLPTPPLSRESSVEGTLAISSTAVTFDFKNAYKQLLRRFSVHPAPHEKLKALYELERLIHASFITISASSGSESQHGSLQHSLFSTPRSSLDCNRRVSTSSAVGTDDLIDEIQRLLRDPEIRPKTLFRDLAFVSSFVTPVTLTHHGEGKVFWDIGLAASAMKADVVNVMVSWYEEIMAGNERATARRRDQAPPAGIGGMKDAARMLVIAACEGNAVGQRELALLHLSHPSLLPLTTFPLTRPSDTFHKVNIKGTTMDKDKYDPDRIALATHWFKLAAKNGDKYAKNVEGNWLGSKKL
jgi:hypothetical protein